MPARGEERPSTDYADWRRSYQPSAISRQPSARPSESGVICPEHRLGGLKLIAAGCSPETDSGIHSLLYRVMFGYGAIDAVLVLLLVLVLDQWR